MRQFFQNKLFRWFLGLPHLYQKEVKARSITVLIPAYNEEQTIANTIVNLKNQTRSPDEIIVVDDCSKDKTGQIARSLGVKLIRLEKNSGSKSQAQNAALSHITTDITITVDADTILHPQAIENIIKPLTEPQVSSVCGLVIPQRIKTFWEKARFIEYLYGISIMKGAQSNTGAILVSSGCFSAFKTEELQKMGFKKRTMAEDMDLTWDFLIQGRKIAFANGAICYPLDPPTYKVYKNQVDRWYRSFFQNVAVHRKNIFKCKRLTFFAGWYLLEGLLSPLMWVVFPLFVLGEIKITSYLILINLLLVIITSLYYGIQLNKKLLVLKSLPCYFFISLVNMFLFWRAFIREWILRDRLKEWSKGH
ncbi:MAG: glycosyltransferase family 2 protein [Candidatus Aerophobetes bacterium]|nr:glycosyltransferase family 2 protein [Candidatus Aerophobetes bacterium]